MSRRDFVLCVIVISVCIQIAMTILVAQGASSQTVVVTVQYSIIGPSNGAGYPTFSYTANGKFNTLLLSGSSTDVTIDSGSTWSISSTLPGSNSSIRWAPAASSGVVNSPQIRVNYYAQCLLGLGFVIIGGGKTPPSVNVVQFGASGRVSAGSAAWVDLGSSYSYPVTISGGTSSERWITSGNVNGAVFHSANISVTYFHQFLVVASYSIVGGGQPTAPSITASAFGSPFSQVLSPIPTSAWMDAEHVYSVPASIGGISGGERWGCNVASTAMVNKALTLSFAYYHQYGLNASYSVLGGSAPTIVYLRGTSDGKLQFFALAKNAQTFWLDIGSSYTLPSVLQPSSDERWLTQSPTQGTMVGPSTLDVAYYHQYQLGFEYVVEGAPSGNAPVLSFVSLGSRESSILSQQIQLIWLDGTTTYSANATLGGSGASERWESLQTSGVVSMGGQFTFRYYHQFEDLFSVTLVGLQSATTPEVELYSFGVLKSIPFSSSGLAIWVDDGTIWTASAFLGGGSGQRWALLGQNGGAVSGNQNISLVYQEQFAVNLGLNPLAGGTAYPQSGWYDAGTQLKLGASAAQSWKFMAWNGEGTSSYSGNESTWSLSLNGPINESAVFYPRLTIVSFGQGSVSYAAGSVIGKVASGDRVTLYVPEGTIVTVKASPSSILDEFSRWGGDVSGQTNPLGFTLGGPASVSAIFGSNLVLRYSVAWAVVVIIASLVIYLVVKRQFPLQQQITKLANRIPRRLSGKNVL